MLWLLTASSALRLAPLAATGVPRVAAPVMVAGLARRSRWSNPVSDMWGVRSAEDRWALTGRIPSSFVNRNRYQHQWNRRYKRDGIMTTYDPQKDRVISTYEIQPESEFHRMREQYKNGGSGADPVWSSRSAEQRRWLAGYDYYADYDDVYDDYDYDDFDDDFDDDYGGYSGYRGRYRGGYGGGYGGWGGRSSWARGRSYGGIPYRYNKDGRGEYFPGVDGAVIR